MGLINLFLIHCVVFFAFLFLALCSVIFLFVCLFFVFFYLFHVVTLRITFSIYLHMALLLPIIVSHVMKCSVFVSFRSFVFECFLSLKAEKIVSFTFANWSMLSCCGAWQYMCVHFVHDDDAKHHCGISSFFIFWIYSRFLLFVVGKTFKKNGLNQCNFAFEAVSPYVS